MSSAFGVLHCGSADQQHALSDGETTGGLDTRDQSTLSPNLAGTGDGLQGSLHPLCGSGTCVPDDPYSCLSTTGAGGMGGSTGSSEPMDEGLAGMGGMAGFGGAVTPNPGDLESIGAACHLRLPEDCGDTDCTPFRTCGASGPAVLGEPCLGPEDCQAGLVCAGNGPTGICRSYCCRGAEESCDDESYCDVRPVVGGDGLEAPVCVPLDNCSLTEPFPCPDGQECTCGDDRACIVVRLDGSTACAKPGPGELGDSCRGITGECAYGYVCSLDQGCMALCSTIGEDSGCREGASCQNPSEFPDHLGVCVDASGDPVAAK